MPLDAGARKNATNVDTVAATADMACTTDTDCGALSPLVCSAQGQCLCSTLRGYRGSEADGCATPSSATSVHLFLESLTVAVNALALLVSVVAFIGSRKLLRKSTSKLTNAFIILECLAGLVFSVRPHAHARTRSNADRRRGRPSR